MYRRLDECALVDQPRESNRIRMPFVIIKDATVRVRLRFTAASGKQDRNEHDERLSYLHVLPPNLTLEPKLGVRPAPRLRLTSRARYPPIALKLDSSAERLTRAVGQRTTTADYTRALIAQMSPSMARQPTCFSQSLTIISKRESSSLLRTLVCAITLRVRSASPSRLTAHACVGNRSRNSLQWV
jgi:hypothetical protein